MLLETLYKNCEFYRSLFVGFERSPQSRQTLTLGLRWSQLRSASQLALQTHNDPANSIVQAGSVIAKLINDGCEYCLGVTHHHT